MKKLSAILLCLSLTATLCAPATAQNSPTYIPASGGPTALEIETPEQAFARLAAEVRSGRALIKEQRAEIAELEKNLAAERERGDSLAKSYAAAERQIAQLERATAALERAVALNEKTIGQLAEQKEREAKRARKANKRAGVATVAVVVLTVLRFAL